MKIVIRHPLTKQYRRADGSWTNEPDQAQQFGGTTDAVKTCLAKELEKYEILMRHPNDPKYDVVILERQAQPARVRRTIRHNHTGTSGT
jgi:hypothetical protein